MQPVTILTALLAWGVLSFGAVYPWAYWPLFAGGAALAVWTWRPRRPSGAAAWAAILLLVAVAMQLVPVGTATLQRLSPGADDTARALDVAYSLGVRGSHALSIEPGLTLRALLFLALCIAWVPVCEAVLRRQGGSSRALARNLAVLGTVIAIIGLAQKATFNGKLLWFWTPQFFATNGFGPFVNRNHFAGWMLLVLAITVGLLFGRLHRVAPARGLPWRERILWLGSPAATPLLLMGAAALVMACALVWTMSRSGIAAAAVAIGILLVAGMRRAPAGLQRWAVAGFLLCTVSGIAAWRGTDTLVGWYGRTATLEWRLQLWRDTVPALRQFWVTGSGLNTYRTLMLTQPRKDLTSHPNAAHNDYLQLAVEGGVLVTVPALLLLGVVGRRIAGGLRAAQDDTAWWIRMGAVAGIAGMAVQEISEFSLQIPGVALLFATALAIAVHDPAPAQSKRHARPREPAAAAAAA